ncbi:MAG: SHOCT domain-containing protein [Acidimicrobiia bacterium]|nr:SHOCT domain-containing protein [Acidimicrobiia bacterium]NND12345.1 SHOCT domain-containing protein [Acidimicrobiia bacterium]NNL27765.1 SHOCT domain-containing protein [Acidimicrobiia bacterium]
MGFGDVVIESAGELGQSRLSNIPHPQKFHSELYRVREERTMLLSGATSSIDKDVASLAQLADLHRQGALTDEEFKLQKARILDSID